MSQTPFDGEQLQGREYARADMTNVHFNGVQMTGARFWAVLEYAAFKDTNLASASFDDVNLSGASFHNINLTGTIIRNANLSGVTIQGANLVVRPKRLHPGSASSCANVSVTRTTNNYLISSGFFDSDIWMAGCSRWVPNV